MISRGPNLVALCLLMDQPSCRPNVTIHAFIILFHRPSYFPFRYVLAQRLKGSTRGCIVASRVNLLGQNPDEGGEWILEWRSRAHDRSKHAADVNQVANGNWNNSDDANGRMHSERRIAETQEEQEEVRRGKRGQRRKQLRQPPAYTIPLRLHLDIGAVVRS